MSYRVSIKNPPSSFVCEEDETVLDAALSQDILLSYGCRDGMCGSCRGKIISGQVTYPEGQPDGITDQEIEQSEALFCKAVPLTDLQIEVSVIVQEKPQQIKKLPVKVKLIEALNHDVIKVVLQLPVADPLDFEAGQWIYFVLKDGRKRAFSIANPQNDQHEVELQIRHVVGGVFTDFVFNQLKQNDLLQIEGPHGSFFYHQDDKPLILVAGGTGFAPIKGIIEELIAAKEQQPLPSMHLFWGARHQNDLYQDALVQSWVEQGLIRYTPVLSEADDSDHWQGKTGYVNQAVVDEYSDLSAFAVYMAGPPQMIQACQQSFSKAGLDTQQLYFDSFDYATDNKD